MLRIKILVKAKTEVLEDGKDVFLLLSEGLQKYNQHPKASQETLHVFLSNSCRPLG